MTYHFALAGNPNSGKTSTFNQLTGAKQTVGNWPGVTVERKAGRLRKDRQVLIQDLPGIYSLSPYTPEELISRNYLMEASLDAVINIIDGTNLERNLYLTLQLLEMNVPTVAAINMIDLLKKKGLQINFEKLAYGLGVPVVGISALKQRLNQNDRGSEACSQYTTASSPLRCSSRSWLDRDHGDFARDDPSAAKTLVCHKTLRKR